MPDTAGEAGTSSLVMYSYGPPHMAEQKQDDRLERACSSSVRIRDVALKTCRRRRTIGRSGERGSVISVLTARHDNDDILLFTVCTELYGERYCCLNLMIFLILQIPSKRKWTFGFNPFLWFYHQLPLWVWVVQRANCNKEGVHII